MMRRKKNLYVNGAIVIKTMVVLFILFAGSVTAKNTEIDSLYTVMKTMQEDTAKVNTMEKIAHYYLTISRDYNKLNEISWKELALAQKLKFGKGISYAYANIGVCYGYRGNTDMAIYYLEKSTQLMKKRRDKKGEGSNYNNIGNVLLETGNYFEAQKNYLKALKISETLADKNGMATAYLNMGNVYSGLIRKDDAMGYYLKAEQLTKGTNVLTYGNACNNIGNIYHYKEKNQIALIYYLRAIKAREQVGDRLGLAITYYNIGNIFWDEERNETALFYYSKAYEIDVSILNKSGMAYASNGIANVCNEKGQYKEALKYLNQAQALSKELGNIRLLRTTYKNFVDLYKNMKEYEQALTYTSYYNEVKDSLINSEGIQQVAEINARYEAEKRAKEILMLTEEQRLNMQIIKQQQFTRWFLVGGIILLFITIISIYRRYLFKQKVNRKLTITQNELYKLIEQKEKLTSILAHDLRTPLRFMVTVSEHLEKNIDNLNIGKVKRFSKELSTTSRNTFVFADELLTWLSIQKQNYAMVSTTVNLNQLLTELCLFFEDIAGIQHTEIVLKPFPEMLVETDDRLLKIILRNVIDNAIKNTQQGVITIFMNRRNDKTIEIHIQDTGKGMTKEQLDMLDVENEFGFQFEIKNKLGFQIIKDLTFKINSKIEVRSEPGIGTHVIVQLPVRNKKTVNVPLPLTYKK